MTLSLQLTLSPELEQRLHQETERQGISADAVALQILQQHLPPFDPCAAERREQERQATLLAMLEQWAKEDEAMTDEEIASNREVLRAIDENRGSGRKLFQDILRDDPS